MTDDHLPARSRIVEATLRDAGLGATVSALPDSTRTAAQAAAALQCAVGAIASSLVFLADDAPLLVMTSGRHRVDTVRIADVVGASVVEMASARQVRTITGQAIGGVAPIGHPSPVRTLVDEALREHDVIWAAAGTPHTVMALTFEELVGLTHGTVCRVSSG